MLAWFSSKGFTKKSLIKETTIHLLTSILQYKTNKSATKVEHSEMGFLIDFP